MNDYATAVRILEGVKEKVENKGQYQAYLDELKPVIQDLGMSSVPSFQRGGSAVFDRGGSLMMGRHQQQGGALRPLNQLVGIDPCGVGKEEGEWKNQPNRMSRIHPPADPWTVSSTAFTDLVAVSRRPPRRVQVPRARSPLSQT